MTHPDDRPTFDDLLKAASKAAEEDAAIDAVVMMSGGGRHARCPECGDEGLHPINFDMILECRSCTKLFVGPEDVTDSDGE